MKDWAFRFQKNKYACLIMTRNARLENVPPSFELVRISNSYPLTPWAHLHHKIIFGKKRLRLKLLLPSYFVPSC